MSAFDDVIKLIQNKDTQQAQSALFDIYNNNLQKAVNGVFDEASRSKYKDYYSFQANAAKFSAYKSDYVLRTLINASEKDPANFEKNAKYILKTFNRYQVTEYNTTLSRCRTARQFYNFKQTEGLYPNLEWLKTRSATPRELHLSYVGIILPLVHSFWKENQPGNLYGCKCDWRRTQKPPTEEPTKIILPAKGLDGNPAITREIFSDKHPYFSKAKDAKSIDEFISDKIFKTQFEKREENYFVHPLLNIGKHSDFEMLQQLAEIFAKEGKKIYIMPDVNRLSGLYQYLFAMHGAYPDKCPDLLIDGFFFEFKSHTGMFEKSKVGTMLTASVKQSNRIILDLRKCNIPMREILKKITARTENEQKIEKVLGWMPDGKIIQIYP